MDAAYPPGWYQVGAKDIEFERSPMQDLWREMEKIAESGDAKNIGISNFNVQLILDLLTYANIKPAALQGKYLIMNTGNRVLFDEKDWKRENQEDDQLFIERVMGLWLHTVQHGAFSLTIKCFFPNILFFF